MYFALSLSRGTFYDISKWLQNHGIQNFERALDQFQRENEFSNICIFKLYVTVVFKVTSAGIVRRHFKHRVNSTAYSKMAESLTEGEISPLITTWSAYWRLSYFLNFTQPLGLFLTARFSGIDSHMKIALLASCLLSQCTSNGIKKKMKKCKYTQPEQVLQIRDCINLMVRQNLLLTNQFYAM